MKNKSQPILPPCALVLHSPWMNGANDEYIGVVTDAALVQCTYGAELKRDVPPITDKFLSFTAETEMFWDVNRQGPDPALSTEDPGIHEHDLSHEHNASGLVGSVLNSSKIDANDRGQPQDHAATLHSHDVTLDRQSLSVSEETTRATHEPLHYEVSAYYVDPESGNDAVVPAGMIVVSHTQYRAVEEHGWIRMDRTSLRRDPRETDYSYAPRQWWAETLKIVGCIPSKNRKGSKEHTHFVEPHNHPSGRTTSSDGAVGADDSRGEALYEQPSHGHPVSWNSTTLEQLRSALNLRRHKRMFIYMASREGARMLKGMMVPFIPRGLEDIDRATASGSWALHKEATAKDFDPVMITSVHPEDAAREYHSDPARDRLRRIKGYNEHDHLFPHHHEITLGASTSPNFHHNGGDWEVPVCDHGHAHAKMTVYGFTRSEAALNPLRYRRVLFLEMVNDQQ